MKNKEQLVLYFDEEKCSGCLSCMIACSYSHFGVIDLTKAHIRIVENPDKPASFIAAHCAHCEHPICEASCPTGALKKSEETGIVTINEMLCIGCKSCNYACPLSMPWFDEEAGVSRKCDLCQELGYPRCVMFCTTGALKLIPRVEARKLVGGD